MSLECIMHVGTMIVPLVRYCVSCEGLQMIPRALDITLTIFFSLICLETRLAIYMMEHAVVHADGRAENAVAGMISSSSSSVYSISTSVHVVVRRRDGTTR